MISCITLKNKSFKLLKVKNVSEENIYKKCGYKTSINFKKIYTWNLDDKTIELWCKEDTNITKYNEHIIFTKNSIKLNINNKCIFFLKNKEQFINLEIGVFNKFFDLKETIESNTYENTNDSNESNESNDTNDNSTSDNSTSDNSTSDINKTNELLNKLLHNNNSENEESYEYNSELSYELYNYSEDEEDSNNHVITK